MTGYAKQSSRAASQRLDCFVARAPRNDGHFMGDLSSQSLRSIAERDASRRIEATAGPFTVRDGAQRPALFGEGANSRLLTVRIE